MSEPVTTEDAGAGGDTGARAASMSRSSKTAFESLNRHRSQAEGLRRASFVLWFMHYAVAPFF
jgi:hypothetical protein